MDQETVFSLIEGGGFFESKGFSKIKITSVENNEVIEKIISLPIKSTGVAEYQENLRGKAPKPPVTRQLVKKDSPEGKELGLPHNSMTIVFDTTDEAYIDALEKHNQEFIWQVAIFALDIEWKKRDGSIAETYEDKKKVLQSNNITGHHIDKIYKDVRWLTDFKEGEDDFLSDRPSG